MREKMDRCLKFAKSRILKRVQLLSIGTFVLSFMMMILLSLPANAESVSGTWTSRIAGEGYVDATAPATFHDDATLKVTQSGSSVSGTLSLTCRKVDEHMSGWNTQSAVGKTTISNVGGSVSGNVYTMTVYADGRTYSFPLTISGGTLKGSGSYVDAAGVTNTWRFDLVGGSAGGFTTGDPDIDFAFNTGRPVVSAVAFVSGLVSLIVSFQPGPAHSVAHVTNVAASPTPPPGNLIPGAPASGVQHMTSAFNLPPNARPFDANVLLQQRQGQATDLLQKVPCPFCGTIVVSSFGHFYCPNPGCAQNAPR